MKISITIVVLLQLSNAQFHHRHDRVAHEAVLENAAQEEFLPPEFLNPFYMNPKIRYELSKSSWFGPGEEYVKYREADRIPRQNIFKVLNHAGLLPYQQL
ncbi:hypothetical protein RI129_010658 [Pyrocoelia pectoralis]|uniref:Uncharacterized protein n=1 Tax=Pyrocoelia pectoralis TaxID=417401 RepID=A0AAN7ZEP2_9COLE